MVDFTTPNLPGASAVYNTLASKVQEIETKVLTNDNLTASASDMTSIINADLTDAKIEPGKLDEALLCNTRTIGGSVSGCDLSGRNLTGVDLREIDLTGAILCKTTMPDGVIDNSGC